MSNLLWTAFVLSLFPLFWCFMRSQIVLLSWEVITLGSSKLEFNLLVDLYGTVFSSTVLLISASVVTFRVNYIREDPFSVRFIMVVLLFILSINFLVYIPNLVALLLGWDGLGIVSFVLVIYYQNPRSLAAGIVTALANRVGDVILILSIAWIVNQGHWNLILIFENPYSRLLTGSILLARITKRAQIPFSRWLPAAMAAPTPVSALVHSSTLVTAGVFLLTRFYPFLEKTYWFNRVCLGMATLTCFIAGICAMQEYDIKKIIALSTLSQLGVIITSLGLGAAMVAYFHIVTHAMFKALLFICAGNVIHQHGGSQDVRFMGNIWRTLPITSSCLNVANLALCGLPFIAGFYSKDLILEIFFIQRGSFLILMIIILRTLFTLIYSIRFSFFIIWGEQKKCALFSIGDEDKNVRLAQLALSTGAVFGGALFSWLLFPFPVIIILTPLQKSLILFSLTLTFFAIFMIEKISYFKRILSLRPLNSFIIHSLRTMWFLSLIFRKISSKARMNLALIITKASDQGWREIFGGQGRFLLSKRILSQVKEAQAQTVRMFILFSFIMVILLILIVF